MTYDEHASLVTLSDKFHVAAFEGGGAATEESAFRKRIAGGCLEAVQSLTYLTS